MDSADQTLPLDSSHWLGQVVPEVECPNCGLHLTYVGEEQQDKIGAIELHSKIIQDKLHSLMAGEQGKASPRKPTPDGYKCFFCEVQPLSTSKSTWRLNYGHFSASDAANAELRKAIIKRDNSTCMDCTLQLPAHMEVRHLDGNHNNNDPANLRCVCPFCHMRDHLGPTGFADAALVIASTRQNQAFINSTVIACWYVLDRVPLLTDIRKKQKDGQLDALQALRAGCVKLLGDLETKGRTWIESFAPSAKETNNSDALNLSGQFTDPYAIGKLLEKLRYEQPQPENEDDDIEPQESVDSSYMTDAYANRATACACLMLLPRREAFETQCKDWFDYFDKYRPVTTWIEGLQGLLKSHGIESAEALFTLVDLYNADLQNKSAGGINGAYKRALEQAANPEPHDIDGDLGDEIMEPDDLDMPAQAVPALSLAEALAQARAAHESASTPAAPAPVAEVPAEPPAVQQAPAPVPPPAPEAPAPVETPAPKEQPATVPAPPAASSPAPAPASQSLQGAHGTVTALFAMAAPSPPAPAAPTLSATATSRHGASVFQLFASAAPEAMAPPPATVAPAPVPAPPPAPAPLPDPAPAPAPAKGPPAAAPATYWGDWDKPSAAPAPADDEIEDNDGIFYDPNGNDFDDDARADDSDDGGMAWS